MGEGDNLKHLPRWEGLPETQTTMPPGNDTRCRMLAALNPETSVFHRIKWRQIVKASDRIERGIGETGGEVKLWGLFVYWWYCIALFQMMKLALDRNCLIDIEQDRPAAIYVKNLIKHNTDGKAIVSVLGITASELQKDGTYTGNFVGFREWLKSLGADGLNLLRPIAVWDVTFWDWSMVTKIYNW
jgi:hypothetical protein